MHTAIVHARRELDEAQRRRAYSIAGEPLARVPFGREAAGVVSREGRCADCFASPGEYHVPGCEHEQCPSCGGRVISCRCAYGRLKGATAA